MKPAIMIVDDAAFMRRLIKKALINGGYDKIIEAENGKAALELYKSERPELVFLDITMPERSGLEVLDGGSGSQGADVLCDRPGVRYCPGDPAGGQGFHSETIQRRGALKISGSEFIKCTGIKKMCSRHK